LSHTSGLFCSDYFGDGVSNLNPPNLSLPSSQDCKRESPAPVFVCLLIFGLFLHVWYWGWTQYLALARQVFYYLSHSTSPIVTIFKCTVLCTEPLDVVVWLPPPSTYGLCLLSAEAVLREGSAHLVVVLMSAGLSVPWRSRSRLLCHELEVCHGNLIVEHPCRSLGREGPRTRAGQTLSSRGEGMAEVCQLVVIHRIYGSSLIWVSILGLIHYNIALTIRLWVNSVAHSKLEFPYL
jgi:hypothetical protein